MSDLIERQAAIDALAKHEKSRGHNYTLFVDIVSECAEIIRDLPSAQPETCAYWDGESSFCALHRPSAQQEWNNHTVACLLAELFNDNCACNYCGIDEWLPEKCELLDSCPNPVGVACWEQFLKHKAEKENQ